MFNIDEELVYGAVGIRRPGHGNGIMSRISSMLSASLTMGLSVGLSVISSVNPPP